MARLCLKLMKWKTNGESEQANKSSPFVQWHMLSPNWGHLPELPGPSNQRSLMGSNRRAHLRTSLAMSLPGCSSIKFSCWVECTTVEILSLLQSAEFDLGKPYWCMPRLLVSKGNCSGKQHSPVTYLDAYFRNIQASFGVKSNREHRAKSAARRLPFLESSVH